MTLIPTQTTSRSSVPTGGCAGKARRPGEGTAEEHHRPLMRRTRNAMSMPSIGIVSTKQKRMRKRMPFLSISLPYIDPTARQPRRTQLKSRAFSCKVCNMKFRRQASCDLHQRVVHSCKIDGSGTITMKRYQCSECTRNFASKKELRKHRKIHTGESTTQCSACGKRTLRRRSNRVHISIGFRKPPFSCTCGKFFDTKDKLDEHLRQQKSENVEVRCVCGELVSQQFFIKSNKDLRDSVHASERENLWSTLGF